METQLEIVCKQSTQQLYDNNDNNHISNNSNNNTNTNNNKSATQQWLGFTFQSIINKLTKQEKQSHQNQYDDWEIPFERIKVNQNDFKRCGSQGDVFYGKLGNTSVAVKRVKDIKLTRIKHLRELNHVNIIKFRGISQNSNYHYIIMEWCSYGTLHDHLHSGRQLSSKTLCRFTQQIASGMRYLHSKSIIHRDLKPSNILLTLGDVLKISDFGTHKQFSEEITGTSVSYAGTQAYMAPEVIRSEPYSYPVDVWSYGVVLWEILIGDEPYKNLDSSAVVWKVGNNSFRLPVPSIFPEGLKLILDGCWKPQPNERLSFQQVCMILEGAVHEVDKISKDRWLPLQAAWRREVRDEMNKHLKFKIDPEEDLLFKQKHQALNDALEQVQRRRDKNNDLYLKLQECSMHLQRERDDVARREQLVSQKESDIEMRVHELNRLKEKLANINEELNRRGIVLDCLKTSTEEDEDNDDDQEQEESIRNTNL